MGDTGLEQTPITPPKTPISKKSGTESGTVGDENGPTAPDLAQIIDHWPTLPVHLKAAIMAIIKADIQSD